MDSTTYCLTPYEAKVIDIMRDIVIYGFGTFSIHVQDSRDFKSKIIIEAGRSYIYFVQKKIVDDGIF